MSKGTEAQAKAAGRAVRPRGAKSPASVGASRLLGGTLGRLVDAVSEPGAREVARINEASTRLHAAVRRMRDGGPSVEPLERRSLMSADVDATPFDASFAAFDAAEASADISAATLSASPVSAPVLPAGTRPAVTSTSPSQGTTGVLLDAFVSANLSVPNGGIDAATLSSATVRLYRSDNGQPVVASVNTSAGGDVLALGPDAPLAAETEYTFEVTEGLKDITGASFTPYVVRFRTGSTSSATDPTLVFEKVALDVPKAAYTALTKGPDGKMYAAVESGEIIRFTIRPDGTLADPQTILSLQKAAGGEKRFLTGIKFDPASTANDLVIWATHSFYSLDNAPDWTGKITRSSGPDLATVQDCVVGLPRSVRDHVTNQMDFGPDGALYISQAGTTAMGAPDYAWHYRSEHLLSAAILRLDTSLIRDRLAAGGGALDVKTEDGGTYNPVAAGAPLTIYATGVRNAYDLLWHSNGSLYAPTNGSQNGGARPPGPACPPSPSSSRSKTTTSTASKRRLLRPPNPTRGEYIRNGGNPTDGLDPNEVSQYPVGIKPQSNYKQPAYVFGLHYSPNGAIEYKGGAFNGRLNGTIMVARYSGGDDIAVLTTGPGGQITEVKAGLTGLKNFNDPLDLAQDLSTGFLYVAEFGGQTITLAKPTVPGSPVAAPKPPAKAPLGPHSLTVSPAGRGTLALRWADTVGETGYKIERSADGKTGWTQIAITGVNANAYTQTGLANATTYSYRVRANNASGDSKFTAAVAGTTSASVLPAGWSKAEVGSLGVRGEADTINGVLEVSGGGAGVGSLADSVHFAGTSAAGDVELVARVASLSATGDSAEAGVMFRGSGGDTAAFAAVGYTSKTAIAFRVRTAPGEASQQIGAAAPADVAWLRLVRRGEVVSAYASADGVTWTRLGLVRVALGDRPLTGLAVSSKDPAKLATAKFESVAVTSPATLAAPASPADLTAVVNGTRVTLDWRDTSLDEAGYEIERRKPDGEWLRVATAGPDATAYADVYLAPAKKYEYRVRAVNAAGSSDPSAAAAVKTGKSSVKGQLPIAGAPVALPATIEAEAFDEGAKGKSWKDRSPENDLGAYRDTGVDIAETSDPEGGTYHVAAAKGEWVEYTVSAPAAGTYALTLRYAADAGFGGAIHFDVDNKKATIGGTIALAPTGGAGVWQTATGAVALKAGTQVLKLSVDAANHASGEVANLNWLKLTPPPATVPVLAAPPQKAALKPGPEAQRIYDALFNEENLNGA